MSDKTTKFIAGAAVLAALTGCGGSGGDQTAGIDRTGTPVPAAAFGTVTAFGSVVVNGVHYDTSNAQFRIDDSPGTQADLAVGDVVLVRGTIDNNGTTGVATTVIANHVVQGEISSVNAAAGTFVVLGQTVQIAADTLFDSGIQPASIVGLSVGDLIEVCGFVDSGGVIQATRVELTAAGAALELTGVVSSHDDVTRRFNVNGQVVDYSAVTLLRDFPASGIANGQTVEVKGGSLAGGVWSPVSIQLKANELAGAVGARREVEGFITRFGSSSDFTVAGLNVTTSAQTAFSGGVAADLALNVKVEVEGTLTATNVLAATKVDIRRSSAVRVASLVDSVNAAAGSFVVLGITVRVDGLTSLEDKSSQRLRPFGVANLAIGDYVDVRGSEQSGGELLATLVERDDFDPDSELRGFVQSVAQPNFTILGVAISTDAGTSFRDVNDSPITSGAFFGGLDVGDLVKVKGLEVGAQALEAEEAQLEN
jgi:hypothetical protein